MAVGLMAPATGTVRPEIAAEGEPETIFRWRSDRCAHSHIPDAPARAFRDAAGSVRLIAAHQINRSMVGPDLRRQRVDCSIIFRGANNSDPVALDDMVWLTAFFTRDGRRVISLGHAEFHGHRQRNLCPAGTYMACWRNAIVAATSTDGGGTFSRLRGRRAAVAALPYDYDGRIGRHTGYFSPSNIIAWNGHLYAFIFAESYRAQRRGACLLRAGLNQKSPKWRAWDGHDFTVALDQDQRRLTQASYHTCKPLAGIGSTITSVVFHIPSRRFVALIAGTRSVATLGRPATGVFSMHSGDLINWSKPALVLELPIMFRFDCGVKAVFGYPSLLDENSQSRNFDTVSGKAHLYLTRFNMTGCKLPMDRDLVRYPVTIRTTE